MEINFKKIKILFVLVILTLFAGCQIDEEIQSQTDEKNINAPIELTETFLTLKDLDELPQAKAIIEKINEAKYTDSSKKSIYNPEYDFFIDTDRILRINNGSFHSLTFPIYRLIDKQNIVENLVLSSQPNGSYVASIYKYEVTSQEKTALLNDQPTDIIGNISRTILQNFNPDDVNARVIQVWYTSLVVIPCSENKHTSKNFGKWHECVAASKPQVRAITRSVLIDVGDDNVGVGSEIGSSGGFGGGGGGNGGYTPPAFDPGKDLSMVKGGITRPLVNIKTAEYTFYYDFLDNNERDIMQFREYRVPLLGYLNRKGWTNESQAHAKQLLKYISDGHGTEDFLNKAIDFLDNHYDITPAQFYNMFLTVFDGPVETPINANNITFEGTITQTTLPGYQTFLAAYPKNGLPGAYQQMPANEVYDLVGGSLLSAFQSGLFKNACSVRGSRGLLYSNPSIHIPVVKIDGVQRSQKGADGKNYILDATSFNKFMISKFGDTPHKLEGADANDIEKIYELFKGKNGIYVIINQNPGTANYNGHVDLMIDGGPIGGAYTSPTGGVKSIRIWVLN